MSGGLIVISRRNAAEHAVRERQRDFATVLQVTESEAEVHELLLRRASQSLPVGGGVVALNRNASDDRLEPMTPVAGDALREALQDAAPRSCLAVRLGRLYQQDPDNEPLLACTICRATGKHTTCVPTLVAGRVVGAVLTRATEPLRPEMVDELKDSVEQVAPEIANVRTIARAELQAQTDPLTGLEPQRPVRARRRRRCPGQRRRRHPDGTSREDAARVAEDLRAMIERLTLRDRRVQVTASFGVAEYPTDAVDVEGFVRAADHALYPAKQGGRNRVVIAPRPNVAELSKRLSGGAGDSEADSAA